MRTLSLGTVGPRVLLLHGNDLCGEFYAPLAHKLAARDVRTTLLTLPGFHREPPLAEPSWSGLVDAVLAAVDPDDPPAVLAGHSMGGLLALLVAARQPPWLRGLAFLEPAIFPTRWLAALAARHYLRRVILGDRTAFANWNGGMRRVLDPALFPPDALRLYLEVRVASDVATGRALFGSVRSLYPLPYQNVAVPALVVRGVATGVVGRLMAWSVRRQLASVQSVVIPGAAHWLAHEQDAAVAAAVADFAHGLPA